MTDTQQLTQGEIDALTTGFHVTPHPTVEDVYALMADMHRQQQQMAVQLNAIVELANQTMANVPAVIDSIQASPLGKMLAKFLPKD